METFTWAVDAKAAGSYDFPFEDVGFGDGYEITVGQGLPGEREKWSCSILGDRTVLDGDYAQAKAFLRRHGAVQPFLWVAPDGATIKVRARELRDEHQDANLFILRFTLLQFY